MTGATPKRFYKEAGIFEDAAGFGVALDGRPVKTPGGNDFRAPTRALARAMAGEWSAQEARIIPATMPLTQLAFVTIDHTKPNRFDIVSHITRFGQTDLVCHRADQPAALCARQSATWDPVHAWAEQALGVRLPIVTGIVAAQIDEAIHRQLRGVVEALDDFRLTAASSAASLAGSALIGLAVARGVLDAETAFRAAMLDELWQLDTWGEDDEARTRVDRVRAEFETVARFVETLGAAQG